MSFSVKLEPGGQAFDAAPEDALLDAALSAGLSMPFGCRNAICRACEAKLVAGEVRYPLGPPAALSAAEIEAGKVLLCQARATSDVIIEAEETRSDVPRTLPCRLTAKTWLSHDVLELRLALRDGDELRAEAGQYVDLVLRDGRRRAFSVANPPAGARELQLQIRVIPDGEFSSYAAEHLKEKALLRVHGPLGNFYLRRQAGRPVLLIAGGTGFAPIKAIIEDAMNGGFIQPMHLYWGVRAKRDLYQLELAERWAATYPGFRFTPVLSEPASDETWEGRTGFVHEAVLSDYEDLSGHAVYLSGPPVMVQAMRDGGLGQGLDPDFVFADTFDYAYVTGHDTVA